MSLQSWWISTLRTCKFDSTWIAVRIWLGMEQLTVFCRGGHAPSYLYRIVSDHYRKEDINF